MQKPCSFTFFSSPNRDHAPKIDFQKEPSFGQGPRPGGVGGGLGGFPWSDPFSIFLIFPIVVNQAWCLSVKTSLCLLVLDCKRWHHKRKFAWLLLFNRRANPVFWSFRLSMISVVSVRRSFASKHLESSSLAQVASFSLISLESRKIRN